MTQEEMAQNRSNGQRWIIPIIVLVVGLLFWWNSAPEYVRNNPRKIRFVSELMEEARAGDESVDTSRSFIRQEAISAIADLTEPWESSYQLEEQDKVWNAIFTGAKGGMVTVFIEDNIPAKQDEQPYRITKVQRGEIKR